METVIQFCGIAALCGIIVIVILVVVCAIISKTGVEEGVGSLADEEREREEGGAE